MPRAQSSAARLDLDTIVDAAIGMIGSDGFEALSMRKLAQRCGVGAMTLYGYIRTKEELLAFIAEHFLSEVKFPVVRSSWQQQLREIFRAVRGAFQQHPELAEIVARQHIHAASAFRGAELAFEAMHDAGLAPAHHMSTFVALVAYTAGFSQRERHLDRHPQMHAQRLAAFRSLPAGEFPHVLRLAGDFIGGLTEQHFEDGLDLIVRGIESRVARP